jgi:phosphatidylglycerophosphatase A
MLTTLLATGFYTGKSPIAPGTMGSLLAMAITYVLVQSPIGWAAVIVLGIGVFFLGVSVSSLYMRHANTGHDPKVIVIDELAGQWLTFAVWYGWLVAITGSLPAASGLLTEVSREPIYLALGFVLFRLCDIIKPWPISLADKRIKGGFGVMFDDVLAAILAGTMLCAAYVLWPLVLGDMSEIP